MRIRIKNIEELIFALFIRKHDYDFLISKNSYELLEKKAAFCNAEENTLNFTTEKYGNTDVTVVKFNKSNEVYRIELVTVNKSLLYRYSCFKAGTVDLEIEVE